MHEAVGFARDAAKTLAIPMVTGRASIRHLKIDMTRAVPEGGFEPKCKETREYD